MSADQHHLTATALITEAPDIMSATVKTRMNYAVPHLLSAAIFSRRLGEIEAEHSGQDFGPFWDEILAHATATVFLAVAGLESYANELFIEMSQNFPGVRQELLEKLWSDYEGKRILEKFDLALLLRGASTRPTGVESFQSVDALVRLRNALMHFKPEWEPARHKRLSSELRSFFKPSEFLASDPGLFPRAWASHKCTVWAVNSVLSFIEHFEGLCRIVAQDGGVFRSIKAVSADRQGHDLFGRIPFEFGHGIAPEEDGQQTQRVCPGSA